MLSFNTQSLDPHKPLQRDESLYVYCGLDAAITLEIREELEGQEDHVLRTYDFERKLQGPVLDMMLRGILVDPEQRLRLLNFFERHAERMRTRLNMMTEAMGFGELNPDSPKQMQNFFYTFCGLPVQWKRDKGVKKPSTDREALEKLETYFAVRPIISHILAYRDSKKKVDALRSGVDPDGRMRFSINIAGTETGRFSSSSNCFGRGMNGQNITPMLRRVFTAAKRRKLAYIDLEQAESRAVGVYALLATGKSTYLDACESGDLHTTVTKMVWDKLAWGTEPDREIAEQPFYRHFTYRDMAKRGGHGTNYYGKPFTMARHLKVETSLMEDFQDSYFEAFPEIPEWHHAIARELQAQGWLETLLGRRRYFLDRLYDDATLRKAIAYLPQSLVADYMNEGLYRVWKFLPKTAWLLLQIHDALLLEYDEGDEEWLIPAVCDQLKVELTLPNGRLFSIPSEPKVGWNWASVDPKCEVFADGNPDGMVKYRGRDERKRQHYPPTSVLDYRLH